MGEGQQSAPCQHHLYAWSKGEDQADGILRSNTNFSPNEVPINFIEKRRVSFTINLVSFVQTESQCKYRRQPFPPILDLVTLSASEFTNTQEQFHLNEEGMLFQPL